MMQLHRESSKRGFQWLAFLMGATFHNTLKEAYRVSSLFNKFHDSSSIFFPYLQLYTYDNYLLNPENVRKSSSKYWRPSLQSFALASPPYTSSPSPGTSGMRGSGKHVSVMGLWKGKLTMNWDLCEPSVAISMTTESQQLACQWPWPWYRHVWHGNRTFGIVLLVTCCHGGRRLRKPF